jgi:prevent-host-death family protein
MFKNISIAEAKAHLSVCIREAEQGESIMITRHGKPVAALVAASHLEQLERLRRAGPQGGLASLAGDGTDRKNWFITLRNQHAARYAVQLNRASSSRCSFAIARRSSL